MIDIIKDIMNRHNIYEFGICSFAEIKPYLIECSAKTRIPDNAKSIICMLFPYYVPIKNHNVSRYAVIPDYHTVCSSILEKITYNLTLNFNKYNFVPFIDNSPIPEVRCGILCGLGVLGDNHLLINKRYGSWVFIGEILTDMSLPTTAHYNECLHCGNCKQVCPGNCIDRKPFEKSNCISYISQKKGELTDKESSILKKSNLIWGCDLCQECCPMNLRTSESDIKLFKNDIHTIITKDSYDKLKNRAFHWRKKSVICRNIDIIKSE